MLLTSQAFFEKVHLSFAKWGQEHQELDQELAQVVCR
jgi:hypothetical protein